MEREVLKNNALELLKKCSKIPGYTIKNDHIQYSLKRYINEYEAVKNRSEEEDNILHNLKIQAHRIEPQGKINNTKSESYQYDDER